jgi:hypothetical protein
VLRGQRKTRATPSLFSSANQDSLKDGAWTVLRTRPAFADTRRVSKIRASPAEYDRQNERDLVMVKDAPTDLEEVVVGT